MIYFKSYYLTLGIACIICLSGCQKSGRSQLDTAKMHFDNHNYKESFQIVQPKAEAGDPPSQYVLGYMYYYGLGVEQDVPKARHWIQQSAKGDYKPAISAMNMLKNQS